MQINKNIENITKQLLKEIGENPDREGLLKTPLRVSKAWAYLTSGYTKDLDKLVNNAIFHEDCDNMIVIKDIEFYSLCEHHLLPFFGRAHVSYIPDGKIIGLSKIPRIVDLFARRLQVQERLTLEVAQTVDSILKPKGVAVVLEANHMCMQMRGVENKNSYATSSSMLGQFRQDHKTRKEFLDLINMNKKF